MKNLDFGTRYYPISLWKTTHDYVKFSDTFERKEDAHTIARFNQILFDDQIFTGDVIKCKDIYDAYTKSEKYLEDLDWS